MPINIDSTSWVSPNFWTPAQVQAIFGEPRVVNSIVYHDTEGLYPSDVDYLCRTDRANLTSAHYYVRKNGLVYQLVDPVNAAWHAYTDPAYRVATAGIRAVVGTHNENIHTIGIERESLKGEGATPEQVTALVGLTQYLDGRFPGIMLDRNHLVGHNELSSLKVDPAPWDWTAFMGKLVPAAPLVIDAKYFPQTGHTVRQNFWHLWQAQGLDVCGYPLTEEMPHPDTVGVTAQIFENVMMEQASVNGPVRFGAVGRRYLATLKK